MTEKKWTKEMAAGELGIDILRIENWMQADLIEASSNGEGLYFDEADIERMRVIRNLMDDLEVNEEGVEVILRMREKTISMEQWMREVFKLLDENHLLTEELVEKFKKLS